MNPNVIVDPSRGWSARRLVLSFCIALAVAGACAAEAAAQPETIPAAWQGVWNSTTVIRMCGNPTIIDQETYSDTLCAGQVVFDDAGVDGQCSGTVSDTAVDYTCVSSSEIDEGCTVTLTFELVATRNGDVLQAVETIRATYSAGCPPIFEDSCEELTTTATRTGEDPQCGQVPAETGSWSSIKAQYR